MPRYRVTISGKTYDAMADLVRKHKLNIAGHTGKKVDSGGYVVDAFADADQIALLRSEGYGIEVREDVREAGKQRQAEVRALASAATASSVATANQYLNVDDIEASLATAAAGPNAGFTQLIKLPNKTWEGRDCHAIKIAHGSQAGRPGIFFLGGVHAREWGSPDILINFVEQICDAFRTQSGITLGGMNVTAAQIQEIVNKKDIYVFPQANPDGRHYSMTVAADWRKNRRPAPVGSSGADCVGVDLNRNHDFLWNYPVHFAASAPIANSTNPCDPEVYIGPAAVSEPETKNVVWMFENFSNTRYFIDVHSYSEDILYSWGDDDDQTQKPQMNFQNAAFDGKRGVANDTGYKEYITAADKTAAVNLAKQMRTAIQAVRGRNYTVMQSMSLYPTAGTSDDYAYSRHIVNPSKPKIFSYTIEWGSPKNETPFHPPYPEMKQIIREITAALLQFCVKA
ncbi:MAG TPA: M14 family metallopeptidase [Thermoanaerobaculia bacterium]|jgi:carboxypeptidase T|nr:M14 family metallopeptidase [Thermoanaerobaculia bacterium]